MAAHDGGDANPMTPALVKLVAGEHLNDHEIESAAGHMLEGKASDVEMAGFIVALRTKGEMSSELAALVRTMLRFSTPVSVPPGAIDTCGTGGDRAGSFNVSTVAALVAAGAGARVVKHGNRAQSRRCGSADVLEALGIPVELEPDAVARCVDEAGVGFCFAQKYHPALRFLGPVRRALGVQTTFNFLGPLANPARVTRQVVGVSDPAMASRVLDVLVANGAEHVVVVHGDDGLAELTTTTTSQVWEWEGGERRHYTLDATKLGLPRVELAALAGGDAMANAAITNRVLAGDGGAPRDVVVLNAAAAIRVAGIADDMVDAVDAARTAIDNGAAADVLERWRAVATGASMATSTENS
ncbi:MAG TPA: anthranilate phosphoribosyltransferase [Acidimicrobiia bacterium]